MDNVISVRLTDDQMALLNEFCKATGWTYSQVIRQLLDSANIRPATIRTDFPVVANTVTTSGQ